LGALFSLVLLDLSHNKLNKLPDLSLLASLTILYLSDNQIKVVDSRIVVVPKLKELSLRYAIALKHRGQCQYNAALQTCYLLSATVRLVTSSLIFMAQR
jgi:Leucine-rich repeat (LRR) protein